MGVLSPIAFMRTVLCGLRQVDDLDRIFEITYQPLSMALSEKGKFFRKFRLKFRIEFVSVMFHGALLARDSVPGLTFREWFPWWYYRTHFLNAR